MGPVPGAGLALPTWAPGVEPSALCSAGTPVGRSGLLASPRATGPGGFVKDLCPWGCPRNCPARHGMSHILSHQVMGTGHRRVSRMGASWAEGGCATGMLALPAPGCLCPRFLPRWPWLSGAAVPIWSLPPAWAREPHPCRRPPQISHLLGVLNKTWEGCPRGCCLRVPACWLHHTSPSLQDRSFSGAREA